MEIVDEAVSKMVQLYFVLGLVRCEGVEEVDASELMRFE